MALLHTSLDKTPSKCPLSSRIMMIVSTVPLAAIVVPLVALMLMLFGAQRGPGTEDDHLVHFFLVIGLLFAALALLIGWAGHRACVQRPAQQRQIIGRSLSCPTYIND